LLQDFSEAGHVKESYGKHGEKRRSHNLRCSLIQLVRWLVMIYALPADDAEWSSASLIIPHCLLTTSALDKARLITAACTLYSKQYTTLCAGVILETPSEGVSEHASGYSTERPG
jgi:hypothetical protein